MKNRVLLIGLWCLLLLIGINSTGWAAQHATVFVYHRFGDSRYSSTNIELPVFTQQLEYLKQNDYVVLPLGEIVDLLKRGEELPDKCVAITVDDGYLTFLTGAMPLLKQYGFPATLFVNTDSVGGKSYLSWAQLRQLHQDGVEIGNHSASHPYFVSNEVNGPLTWYANSFADITKASDAFSDHLGVKPQLFAYPYGEYSPQLERLIEELGFEAAVAQQSGAMTKDLSFYSLPRFPMGGPFATFNGFKNKLAMLPMPVTVKLPKGPVVQKQNPPVLTFTLQGQDINLNSLRCYVQGQDPVTVEKVDGDLFRVVAKQPLAGRRNKYTLTAQSRDGRCWYWFSHLWVRP
ncbi:MAG: hypothetical protein BA874_03590 [Desulfuromonadales bacterium C00003068]|jgi:peptidoglycan/xylan/chitin deacetylase (PgdA/CDA1 family)|nr:MAG: hypothetical protein BA874_03590 [Desulfuromonadales bacterium C00003068]